jgi:hypothetical protein
MTTWTLSHIEKLSAQKKIKGFKVIGKGTPAGEIPAIPKPEPAGLAHIKSVLEKRGIRYVTEHQFVKTRKFRFDVAVLNYRLAVEYEGLAFKKTGHTTSDGYTKNTTKYNISALEGWTLLRYTFKNFKDFEQDLITFLSKYK